MKTVLITGGTGLVGTALTLYLLDLGYRVLVLGRSGASPDDVVMQKAIVEKDWSTGFGILQPEPLTNRQLWRPIIL